MTGGISIAGVRRFLRDLRGLGAVEFALAAPFMILLYIGGFQLMDAISAYRKVVTTDRTLADLTTQNTSLTKADADAILDGARQVMAPYSTANTTLAITQIKINNGGQAKVDWTRSNDGTKIKNKDLDVPPDIAIPNTYVILSQITYRYHPRIAGSLVGDLVFTDHMYMNPRRSNSIPLS